MNTAQFLDKTANERHIAAIRRGLLLNMPLVVVGSLAIMMNNLPLSWYQQLMQGCFGQNWFALGQVITNVSLNIMSILLTASISYFLAEQHRLVRDGIIRPIIAPLVSISSFMALIQPFLQEGLQGMPYEWTGTGGVFLAVLVGLVSTDIFLWMSSFRRINIEVFTDAADPVMSQALRTLIPAALTVTIFALIKVSTASFETSEVHDYLYSILGRIMESAHSSLAGTVVLTLMVHGLWFCGLHGNHIVGPFLSQFALADVQTVSTAGNAGLPLAAELTKTFLDSFVLIGGSGSTACLILAVIIVSRNGNTARLAKLSIIPGLFNINEILIFGLPIVFNPIYLIPFLLVPVVLSVISYMAIATGVVAAVQSSINWTTPLLISGYLATGSWSGLVLQLLNVIIGTSIYLPFVILNERQKTKETSQAFSRFLEEVGATAFQLKKQFLARNDSLGSLARILAYDLKAAIATRELYLEYQPQVNCQHQVIGVEALLRWKHRIYGQVPPPLIIAVAEETGLIRDVGRFVFTTAASQMSEWKSKGMQNIRLSVNVSALQLQDERFADDVLQAVRDTRIDPEDFEIEITENIALNNDSKTIDALEKLREVGIKIAIDDFGMGHTSLRYIKHYPVDTLKIDKILSKDVLHDNNCQEIITSIIALCSSLDIKTIVEYVETEEQRDKLMQLGCTQYQGYLYSAPLSPAHAAEYIRRLNSVV